MTKGEFWLWCLICGGAIALMLGFYFAVVV